MAFNPATDANPPYHLEYAFDPELPIEGQIPEEIYRDNDGKIVPKEEHQAWWAWYQTQPEFLNPPTA